VTGYDYLAVCSRQFRHVVGYSVEIRCDLIWRQIANCLTYSVPVQRACSSAVWSHARKQVGGNGDITSLGKLVSKTLYPITHTKDLMDYNHCRCFIFHLRVDHETVDLAIAIPDL